MLRTLRDWLDAFNGLPALREPLPLTVVAEATDRKGSGSVACIDANISEMTLLNVLCKRYGCSDSDMQLLRDRIATFQSAIQRAIRTATDAVNGNGGMSGSSFDLAKGVAIVCSPGRDRLFMGHSDMIGLGGFTVDAATKEELIAIAQATNDGMITLLNADPTYPLTQFAVSECESVAASVADRYGTKVWPATDWSSYVKGALAFMLCQRFPAYQTVKHALSHGAGMRLLIVNEGKYQLPASGGTTPLQLCQLDCGRRLSHR